MGSYINLFLKTELTVIPGFLDKYLGKYYNNTLCNGASWMFLTWYILHVIFDDVLNALLRRMKYKEYVRVRLTRSLWYLGFYSTAFIYCAATLICNNIPLFEVKKPFDSTNTPSGHLILGYIVVLTFYLHSAFWERLKYCYGLLASTYLCLFFILCVSYFLRFVEGSFRLTLFICSTQIVLELARYVVVLIKRDTFVEKLISGIFFSIAILFSLLNYMIVVPLLFGYPLIKGFSSFVTILLTLLIIWLFVEIYASAVCKAVVHWVNHDHDSKAECGGSIIECSLFPPRNDATYNFQILRKEMKEREEKCISLRKPKSRNVVFQTLKCMVAIKRKLNEKRQEEKTPEEEESSDKEKDVPDEKSDNCDGNSSVSEEIVGGKLEFNINNKNEQECKCKTE